jgi:hypothetical protein
MIEEVHIVANIQTFCQKLNAGIICTTAQEGIEFADKLRTVNLTIIPECEFSPVPPPTIICLDDNIVLKPKYEFTVGSPSEESDSILYGFYNFVPGNPTNPIAFDIAADIINQDSNYTITTWVTDAPLEIEIDYTGGDGIEACYHIIRLNNGMPSILIKDATDLDVTIAWTVLTDADYVYYLLKVPIAISDVTYKLHK